MSLAKKYSNRVYLVFDIEHVGNGVYTNPPPFAFGAAVIAFIDGAFRVRDRFNTRILIEVDESGANPDTVEWWKRTNPELFADLRSGERLSPADAAVAIKTLIDRVVAAFPGKTVVVAADAFSDFTKIDALLDSNSLGWINQSTSPSGYGATLHAGAWLRGMDDILALSKSTPLSSQIVTEHAHTHDPLDDALELAERIAGMLNSH